MVSNGFITTKKEAQDILGWVEEIFYFPDVDTDDDIISLIQRRLQNRISAITA